MLFCVLQKFSPSLQYTGKYREEKHGKSQGPRQMRTLKEVTFNVQPGELVGVVGRVGSGKSSLLLALLNEMQDDQEGMAGVESLLIGWIYKYSRNLTHKSVHAGPSMSGTVAYVSQVPWVRAGSVKDNILFGDSMEKERYDEVIDACALGPDLERLPHDDETELGERGINLSGIAGHGTWFAQLWQLGPVLETFKCCIAWLSSSLPVQHLL